VLPELDLEPTPSLCSAYGIALHNLAAEYPTDLEYYVFEDVMRNQLPNMEWMIRQHCAISSVLEVVQKARSFGTSTGRRSLVELADHLEQLQHGS
jgi:hypothetical protein